MSFKTTLRNGFTTKLGDSYKYNKFYDSKSGMAVKQEGNDAVTNAKAIAAFMEGFIVSYSLLGYIQHEDTSDAVAQTDNGTAVNKGFRISFDTTPLVCNLVFYMIDATKVKELAQYLKTLHYVDENGVSHTPKAVRVLV